VRMLFDNEMLTSRDAVGAREWGDDDPCRPSSLVVVHQHIDGLV